MMRRLGISSLALALVVLPATARAQIGGSGSIQGTILDASGAALQGATVTATHVSTGVDTVRQATGAGVYTVSPLAPGEYRVTVVLQGFQTFVQESVTVSGQAPLLDNRQGLLELRNIAAARMTPEAVADAARRVAAWKPAR